MELSVNNLKALTGIALDQFMDRVDAERQEHDADTALASLRAQPLKADSLDAIDRLHVLWVNAGDAQAAKAVLEQDAAALLLTVPGAQQPELNMNLAFLRLRLANYLNEDSAMLEQLEALAAMATQTLDFDVEHYRQHRLFDELECGSLEVALQTIEVRHRLATANPDRVAVQAWDLADRHQRRAGVLAAYEQHEQAREAALHAVTALRTAGADQDVDAADWVWLGNALIEIIPLRLAMFEQPITQLTAHLPLPQQREWEVQMARLAARSKYAQGELAQALEICAVATLSLDCEGGHNFIHCHLPWLMESGQIDAAGQRAFHDVYELGSELWPGTVRLVHERLQDPEDQRVWWPLCVMRACARPEALHAFIEALPPLDTCSTAPCPLLATLYQATDTAQRLNEVFALARAEAQRRAPDHYWIKRLAAVHDGEAGIIDAPAQLALLLEAAHAGNLQDNRTAFSLFTARVHALGVIAALRHPAPIFICGLHAYNYAGHIDNLIEEQSKGLPATERQEAKALLAKAQIHAYEQGLAHMERYFASGTGHPFNACTHLYSMLCNNLAIQYQCAHEPSLQERAINLHQRGIQASPFAEHYDGILRVYRDQNNHSAIVEAAEQLWHYALEFGYGRHELDQYICDVAYALLTLNRSGEILIWIERLLKCQEAQGISDQQLTANGLISRMVLARYLAHSHPDNAYALWLRYAPQVETANMLTLMVQAASMFERLGRRAEAIEYYQRALLIRSTEADWANPDASAIKKSIAELQRAERAANKSWWQIWK